jgi:hypothetical protein
MNWKTGRSRLHPQLSQQDNFPLQGVLGGILQNLYNNLQVLHGIFIYIEVKVQPSKKTERAEQCF